MKNNYRYVLASAALVLGVASAFSALETDDAYNRRLMANGAFVKADKSKDYKISEADGKGWETYGHLDADQDGYVSIDEFVAGAELPYPKWDGKVTRNIVYKRAGDEVVLLDVYEPRKKLPGKAPVLYYTHGGGWVGGSKEISGHIQEVASKLSDQGFAVVGVRYRLVKLWSKDDPVLMRDCAVDCRDGLRFLKKHEDELSLDMDRVVVFGSSAGGHLTQLLTFSGADDFAGDPALAQYKVRVAGGVSWFGPSDFRDNNLFEWTGPGRKFEGDHWARNINKSKSFDYKKESAEVRKWTEELSPVVWLKKDSAPLLHIHGDQDVVIAPPHAAHLKKHAEAVGADVTVQMVKGAPHGWWTPGIEPTKDEIVQMSVDFAVDCVQSKR